MDRVSSRVCGDRYRVLVTLVLGQPTGALSVAVTEPESPLGLGKKSYRSCLDGGVRNSRRTLGGMFETK